MEELNPELERQIDALAEICCSVFEREGVDVDEETTPLIEALVTGGYARLSKTKLQPRLEARALEKCQPLAMHRRSELSGITGRIQQKFDELVKWKTQSPQDSSPPKAANISSATDA